MAEEEKAPVIVIKKIKKGGGHHGGAWKVAYADFVTAMMAFFLLLWLLNVTTDEQKNAISNYFDPTHPKVSDSSSGAGGVMGGLSMSTQGSMATNIQDPATPPRPSRPPAGDTTKMKKLPDSKPTVEKAKEVMRREEEKKFKDTEAQIKKAIQEDPELAALAKNLIVDMTPEGLRIQIIDQEGKPMFASGSADMYETTRKLIEKVGKIVEKLPNELSVRGHTDSVPYGTDAKYTNWELSTDRANASRRVILQSGVPVTRLNNVVGKADTEHLIKDNPKDARNRRISIILLKEELTDPNFEKKAEAKAKTLPAEEGGEGEGVLAEDAPQIPVGTFKKTPGKVQFP
ncbi:MAG: flagellar motor protein MotB [Alphaproteobacteria bacterium]